MYGYDTDYHPVLGTQAALNATRHGTYSTGSPITQDTGGYVPMNEDSGFGIAVDIDSTPKWVAGYGITAIVVLALLKYAGFRFSVGVAR